MRASRNRRNSRSSPATGMMPRLGIDPSRSIQPRRPHEVLAARVGTREVHGEVHQEDDADEVVVEAQGVELRGGERQQQQDHDRQRHDGQDEDEDVVGVAVLSCRHRRLDRHSLASPRRARRDSDARIRGVPMAVASPAIGVGPRSAHRERLVVDVAGLVVPRAQDAPVDREQRDRHPVARAGSSRCAGRRGSRRA